MKILNRIHFHPYLIGIFPVLSLYAHNQSQLRPEVLLRSLAVISVGTTIVFILLRLYFKDWYKAGFVTSYASLVFFLYNPLREVAYKIHFSEFNLGWNRYFFPVWVLILVLGIWMILKKLPQRESTVQLFNLIGLVTLLLPFVSITSTVIGDYLSKYPFMQSARNPAEQVVAEQPDIYYIILDMHGRSDTIEQEFGYDNLPFLEELREQGFYVASCSTSNYSETVLSMASSLNMNFLPALGDDFVPENTDYSNSDAVIEHNAVRQYLQKYGYTFVAFESGFPYVDIPDADIYIKTANAKRNDNIAPFELLLIEQTPIRAVVDEIVSYSAKRVNAGSFRIYGQNYDRTLFALQKLTQLPKAVPGPKFVYAHLIIPHPPYIFGPNGEYVGNDERLNGGPNHAPVDVSAYHLGYTNQVRYIDSLMPDILEQLISQSESPPIIIVQGDHGFWGGPERRLPILNAYYLPGKDASQLLYPEITPVNSFRVILNTYFDGQFELLPDVKYMTLNDEAFYEVEQLDEDAVGCKPK